MLISTLQEMGWKRSDYVVSTKIFWGGSGPNDKGLSRKHIIEGTRVQLPPKFKTLRGCFDGLQHTWAHTYASLHFIALDPDPELASLLKHVALLACSRTRDCI